MLMRTQPSPAPEMIRLILSLMLPSSITKDYLSSKSHTRKSKRCVLQWIIKTKYNRDDGHDVLQVESSEGAAVPGPESPAEQLTLYEGLQIMRKGRFEDQRGTEICFEIPEFLRLPENW